MTLRASTKQSRGCIHSQLVLDQGIFYAAVVFDGRHWHVGGVIQGKPDARSIRGAGYVRGDAPTNLSRGSVVNVRTVLRV